MTHGADKLASGAGINFRVAVERYDIAAAAKRVRIAADVQGVFLAEPISNLIGGLACFTTMYLKVYRKLDSRA